MRGGGGGGPRESPAALPALASAIRRVLTSSVGFKRNAANAPETHPAMTFVLVLIGVAAAAAAAAASSSTTPSFDDRDDSTADTTG